MTGSSKFSLLIQPGLEDPIQPGYRSMRFEPLIWQAWERLTDNEITKLSELIPGGNINPGNFSLFVLDPGLLSQAYPISKLQTALLEDCMTEYQLYLQSSQPVAQLETAAKLAVVLLEKRKISPNWSAVVTEPFSRVRDNDEGAYLAKWKLPFGILENLVQDREELVTAISNAIPGLSWEKLLVPVMMMAGQSDEERIELTAKAVQPLAPENQVRLLREFIRIGESAFSTKLAACLINAYTGIDLSPTDAKIYWDCSDGKLPDSLLYQNIARIAQIAGDNEFAEKLLTKAHEIVSASLLGIQIQRLNANEEYKLAELTNIDLAKNQETSLEKELGYSKFTDANNNNNPTTSAGILKQCKGMASVGNGEIALSTIQEEFLKSPDKFIQEFGNGMPNFNALWKPADSAIDLLDIGADAAAEDLLNHLLGQNPTNEDAITGAVRLYKTRRDWNQLIPLLEGRVIFGQSDRDELRDLITSYSNTEQHQKAFEISERLLTNSDVSVEEKNNHALIALKIGRVEIARNTINDLLATNPDDPKVLCTSGKIAIEEDDLEGAKRALTLAIERESVSADPWITLSDLYRKLSDDQSALSILKNGLVAQPINREIKIKLAKTLFETGSKAEALPLLTEIRKSSPEAETGLLLLRTMKELKLDGLDGLVAELFEEHPRNPEIAFEYADQCRQKGDFQTSAKILKHLFEEKQVNPEWIIAYADASIGLDPKWSGKSLKPSEIDLRIILRDLNEYRAASPRNLKAELLHAEILQQKGLIEEAHEIYSKLLESNSGDEKSWFRRVQTWFAWTAGLLGKLDVAMAAIRDVVNAEPEWIGARQVMAEITAMTEDMQSAVEQAEEILEVAPEIIDNQLWAGDFFARVGEVEKAEEVLKDGARLQPDDIRFDLALSSIYEREGKTEENKGLLHELTGKLISLENDNLLYESVRILEKNGETGSIEEILTQRLDDNRTLENMLNLAGYYYQQNQFEESLNLLGSFSDIPKHADYMECLKADTLFRLAMYSQALQVIDSIGLNDISRHSITPTGFIPAEWVQVSTSKAPATELKMRIHFEVGEAEKALTIARELVALEPGSGLINLVGVQSSLAIGAYEWKEDLFHLAAIDKADQFYALLAALKMDECLEKGSIDEAWSIFNELASPLHVSPLIRVVEASLLVLEGNTVEAEEIFDSVVNDDLQLINHPLYEQAGISHLMVHAAMRLSRWSEALLWAQDSCKRMPWHQTLSAIYLRTLIQSLEINNLCKLTDTIAHSPSKTLDNINVAEELEWLTQNIADSEVTQRLLLRGELAINPNQENIKTLAQLKPGAEDAAAIMAALYRLGQTTTALQLAQKFPEDPQVLTQKAMCESATNFEAARSTLDKIINKQSTNALAIYLRATYLQKASRAESAIQDMESAIQIWPGEVHWHKTAADWWTKLGNESNAVPHWQAAFQNSPQDISTGLNLGKGLTTVGKAEEAIDILKELTTREPNGYEIWEALTDAYLSCGKSADALTTAIRASEVNPFSTKPYLLRAQSYLDDGKVEEALGQVEKADQQTKNDADVKVFKAKVLFRKGDKAGALAALEDATRCESVSPKTILEEIKLIREINGKASAKNLIEFFSQRMPENVELLGLLAESQLENGDSRDAEITARRALKIAPDSTGMLLFLGKQQASKGQLDQAIHSFSQVIKLTRDNLEAYYLLGEVYEKQREYLKAIEIIKQAVALKPENPQGYLVLSNLYKNSKNYRLAEEMLKKAADIDPRNIGIKRQLGALLALNLVHQSQEASSSL